jgi:hypothetical protein
MLCQRMVVTSPVSTQHPVNRQLRLLRCEVDQEQCREALARSRPEARRCLEYEDAGVKRAAPDFWLSTWSMEPLAFVVGVGHALGASGPGTGVGIENAPSVAARLVA